MTPWTAAHQAPLSTGFSRQEYWSGLPLLSPGNLPDPGSSWVFLIQGLNLGLLHCRQTPYHLSHKGLGVSILVSPFWTLGCFRTCSLHLVPFARTVFKRLLHTHLATILVVASGQLRAMLQCVPLKLPPALLTSQLCSIHLLLPLAAALG